MAENRRGLGRGLSALLGEAEDENAADAAAAAEAAEATGAAQTASPLRDLPIDLIDPNASQPRSVFHDQDMEELTNSIRERGVLQPILVRPLPNGRFEIVAGERRWREPEGGPAFGAGGGPGAGRSAGDGDRHCRERAAG